MYLGHLPLLPGLEAKQLGLQPTLIQDARVIGGGLTFCQFQDFVLTICLSCWFLLFWLGEFIDPNFVFHCLWTHCYFFDFLF